MPELTRAEVEAALEQTDGNKSQAARILGVPRSTLRSRIDTLGLSAPDSLEEICERENIPIDDVGHAWIKTDDASIFVRRHSEPDFEAIADRLCERLSGHVPGYDLPAYQPGETCLVADLADVHIGKLCIPSETGHRYDIKEACRRMAEGIEGLLAKALPHGVERIIVPIGNDILHVDTPRRTTTSGTPQDTDGMWTEMFDAALEAMQHVIERAAAVAPVHCVFVPSNHDFISGFYLGRALQCLFKNHPGVTMEPVSMSIRHRKYLVYGDNLLGFTHGDGAKERDLPLLMATEARDAWGKVSHCYMHCHHLHHKIRNVAGLEPRQVEKDHIGVTTIQASAVAPEDHVFVEYVRSPSAPDGWHDRNGYTGNPQAVEAFLYAAQGGQVARFTHYF